MIISHRRDATPSPHPGGFSKVVLTSSGVGGGARISAVDFKRLLAPPGTIQSHVEADQAALSPVNGYVWTWLLRGARNEVLSNMSLQSG